MKCPILVVVVAAILACGALVGCNLNPQPFPPQSNSPSTNDTTGGGGSGSSGGGARTGADASAGFSAADAGGIGADAPLAPPVAAADGGAKGDGGVVFVEAGAAEDATSDALSPTDAPNETKASAETPEGTAAWDVAVEAVE
jgi:hypothetical protein